MERNKLLLIMLSVIYGISIFALYMIYKPVITTNRNILEKYYPVIRACQILCEYAKQNLTLDSQCLSDLYPQIWEGQYGLTGWVCDVAHYPRKPQDNLPKNQCKAFLRGFAKNFVEVDPNCTPIKIYVYGVTNQPVLLRT